MVHTNMFDQIDRMDADGWSDHLALDVVMRLGNEDPVYGRPACRARAQSWFEQMRALSHHVVARWQHGDTTIVETSLTITPPRGDAFALPSVTIFRTEPHGLISDYRVYMDPSPLRDLD